MADGYKNAGEYDFADLDEWLCEYVDGTIDPVVCKALEEYMDHNPELASHVERLRETRHLLCQYGCSYQAPRGLQPRLRRRLATEIVQESQPILGASAVHLVAIATITSVVAFLLIFGSSNDTVSTTPVTANQSTKVQEAPSRLRSLAPSRRATPLNTLSNSKYFSQFARQPATLSRAHLSPSLYPHQNNRAGLQTAELTTQPAEESFTTP